MGELLTQTQEEVRRLALRTEFTSITHKMAEKSRDARIGQYIENGIKVGDYSLIFYKQTSESSIIKSEAFQIDSRDTYATFTLDETGIQRGLVPNENEFSIAFFPKIKRSLNLDEMEKLLQLMRSPHLNEELIEGLIKPTKDEAPLFEAQRAHDEEIQRNLSESLRRMQEARNPGFIGDYDPDDPDDWRNIRY